MSQMYEYPRCKSCHRITPLPEIAMNSGICDDCKRFPELEKEFERGRSVGIEEVRSKLIEMIPNYKQLSMPQQQNVRDSEKLIEWIEKSRLVVDPTLQLIIDGWRQELEKRCDDING